MRETPYLKVFMRGAPYSKELDYLTEKLKKLPNLKVFGEEHIKKILELSKIRKYEPKETIITQGMYDRWMYVIISGEVKIIKDDQEIATFNETGDLFGEMTAIDGKARSASVFAHKETICLAIDSSFLDTLKSEEHKVFSSLFYQMLAEILARRLRAVNEELSLARDELISRRSVAEDTPEK